MRWRATLCLGSLTWAAAAAMRRPRPLHGRRGRGGAGSRQGTLGALNCVRGFRFMHIPAFGVSLGGFRAGEGGKAKETGGGVIDKGESCSDGMRAVLSAWWAKSPEDLYFS